MFPVPPSSGGASARFAWLVYGVLLCTASVPRDTHACALTKATISGGAAAASGGSFRMGATIGEAGVVGETSGEEFRLLEGFWHPGIGVPATVEMIPVDPTNSGEALHHENGLAANLPNPFRETTRFSFSVARISPLLLVIYDVGGRRVRTLVSGTFPAGRHQATWDGLDDEGSALASGVYFARLVVGPWNSTRLVLRMR